MMRRVLCVRLPHWPLQRIQVERPELSKRPVVLYTERGRSGLTVVDCSPLAARAGIAPGLPLAEAQALLARTSSAHWELHDPQADRTALLELAAWCRRFSPLVGLEEAEAPDSLLLDVTGVAHLFGDEPGLAHEVVQAFQDRGYRVRIGLAEILGAAWAVAHFGEPAGIGGAIVPAGRLAETLAPLPVEGLRLPATVLERLHALDLRRIDQLERLPRAGLTSRFGAVLLQRLDQALGRVAETLVPYHPAEPIVAEWPLEYPTADRRVLDTVCRELLPRIVDQVARRGEGVQQLWCSLEMVRPSREPVRFPVELVHPRASADYLLELIRLRLERIALPAEVECVRLQAGRTGPLECRQRELFDNGQESEHRREFRTLLDRLSSRLGTSAVLRPRIIADHQPERAVRFDPAVGEELPLKKRKRTAQSSPARARRASSARAASISSPPYGGGAGGVLQGLPACGRLQDPHPNPLPGGEGAGVHLLPLPLGEGRGEGDLERIQNPESRIQNLEEKQPAPPSEFWILNSGFSPTQPVPLSTFNSAAKRSPLRYPLARPLLLMRRPVVVHVWSVVPDGPPMRLEWNGRIRTIARNWGPERIATGWWRNREVRRDYYRIETGEGERFWLFRRIPEGNWYLHGEFA